MCLYMLWPNNYTLRYLLSDLKACVHTKAYTQMFIAALSRKIRNNEEPVSCN